MPNIEQKVIIKGPDDEFIKKLVDLLLIDKKVKVTHFGIFKLVKCKGRRIANIFSRQGQEAVIRPYGKIKFIPTNSIKKRINEAFRKN